MAVLSYGSSGDEVKQLQTALNSKGYTLDVDGQFGPATQAAVRDYQSKNNLTVDGYAGPQTQNSLYGASAPAASSGTAAASGGGKSSLSGVSADTASALAGYEAGYQPSAATESAKTGLEQVEAAAPGGYESPYSEMIQKLYDEIVNHPAFSYDVNGDALYRQYKDQYTAQGKQAMMDTQGQAAGLTGGYGSSYGQSVGQQTYDSYLQKLNDAVPDLYNQAYSRYENELSGLYDQASQTEKLESDAYSAYRDQVSDYAGRLSAAQKEYDSSQANDLSRWKTMLDYYRQKANAENDDYWTNVKWAASQAESASSASGSSSRSSSSGSSSKSSSKKTADMSDGVKSVIASVMGETDARNWYKAKVLSWPGYNGYIGSVLKGAYRTGRITKDEYKYLRDYYGL